MKKLGKSAIHDKGFQFYLTLKMQFKIEELLKDMATLNSCIEWHKSTKKENWYNSKVKFPIRDSIDEYKIYYEFTLNEAEKLYKEFKSRYDLLLDMCEKALKSATKDYEKYHDMEFNAPFLEDLERVNIIVEEPVK